MRKILFILIVLSQQTFGQLKPGDVVPDLTFPALQNANVKSSSLQQLKGKVVLIEFWATWCGSCLQVMPHLQALQKQYNGRLQVIGVSNETANRVALFLKSRPSNYWFTTDVNENLSKQFPHQLLPHTVLIGADGRLIASTTPEAITPLVLDSVLAGKKVHLPKKNDLIFSSPEKLMSDLFPAADSIRKRFLIQPEIDGAPGFSTTYPQDKTWKGKRITAVNCALSDLYRLAYGGYSYKRTIDNTPKDVRTVYCIDLIAENEQELRTTLKKELAKLSDVQAKITIENKEVYVLSIADKAKFDKVKRSTATQRTFYARHGEIDQQVITMGDFAGFLESYGVGNFLVLDETRNTEKFDFKFSFQPEDPKSLIAILSGMGLSLTKVYKNIELLTIYKE